MIDLTKLSYSELNNKLYEIREICINNTDLSAHLLDLKMQEMQAIHEEISSRKTQIKQEVLQISQRLHNLISEDAIRNGMQMTAKHHKAKAFVDAMESRAMISSGYALSLILWSREGGTSVLRDNLLRPLLYNNDKMEHFNAFTLLDDCGIKLRNSSATSATLR
jgi:hypothetical protein